MQRITGYLVESLADIITKTTTTAESNCHPTQGVTTAETKKLKKLHILTKRPKFSSVRKEKIGDKYISTEDIGRH